MSDVLSPRARIRGIAAELTRGQDEIRIPNVTSAIVHVLLSDAEFLEAFTNDSLRAAVYEEVRAIVADRRDLTPIGDEVLSAEVLRKRAKSFADRFMNWYEHAGDRHVNLMEMTREDLLLAAAERKQRGDHELRIAALWTHMANGMEGGQRVQDRFTAEDIESLYTRIESATEQKAG